MSTDPTKNVGTRVKALPHDENRHPLSAMLVPIVSGGEIVGYLPVKGVDNNDGTATLASTVNVTLDADVDIGDIHLLNIANAKIDPATEQKQNDIITAIGGISSVDPVGLKNVASTPINPATEDTLVAGVAEHHNGSATTTPAPVNFSGTSKAILIDNLDASKNLLVSFDGGTTTKTVPAGQSLSIEANHASVEVSSASGTVAFEMLVTV